MPVIDSICGDHEKRAYRKWQRLYPLSYIGVCKRGCHGGKADNFDAAIEQMKIAQAQCDLERHDSD